MNLSSYFGDNTRAFYQHAVYARSCIKSVDETCQKFRRICFQRTWLSGNLSQTHFGRCLNHASFTIVKNNSFQNTHSPIVNDLRLIRSAIPGGARQMIALPIENAPRLNHDVPVTVKRVIIVNIFTELSSTLLYSNSRLRISERRVFERFIHIKKKRGQVCHLWYRLPLVSIT